MWSSTSDTCILSNAIVLLWIWMEQVSLENKMASVEVQAQSQLDALSQVSVSKKSHFRDAVTCTLASLFLI